MTSTEVTLSGEVQLMNGETGSQIGTALEGEGNSSVIRLGGRRCYRGSDAGDFYILSAPNWDNIDVDAGLVRMIFQ